MARGRFDRNEIEDRDGNWLYIEKEEKIKKGGSIFLAIQQYGFDHGTYSIYWRKTRNVVRYGWNGNMNCFKTGIKDQHEAEAYFARALKTFDPGPGATKRRRREVTDSQRKRVYAWERELFQCSKKHPLNEKMAPKQLKDLFTRILDHYDIPKNERPLLKFRSCYGKSTFNHAWGSRKPFIRLSKTHLKPWVVIHELAHFLTDKASPDQTKVAGHGPEFVGWYIDALVEIGGQNLSTLLRSCRDFEYKTKKRTMKGVKCALPTTNEVNSLKEAA